MCLPPPERSAPPWLDRGHIPSLDGLRALAILLVLFAHCHFPGTDAVPLAAVRGRCGFLGVQLFFLLSGFLITTLMLRESAREGGLDLLGFYRRRSLRILPAYGAFLAVLFAFQVAGTWHLSGHAWLALLTYTVNFPTGPLPWQTSHVWSLSVEEHFYLVWPLLFCLPGRGWFAAAAVPAAFVLRWAALAIWPGASIDLWTPTRMDDLAIGCLLAFAARDAGWRAWLDRVTGSTLLLAGAVAVFLVGQVVLSRMVGGRLFGPALPPFLALANTVSSAALALLLWWAVNRPDRLPGGWLNSRGMVGVSTISYGLYLWHPLFLPPAGAGWSVAFPLNLVLAFAAAITSYFVIERPFLQIKGQASQPSPPDGEPVAVLAQAVGPGARVLLGERGA